MGGKDTRSKDELKADVLAVLLSEGLKYDMKPDVE